MGKNRVVVEKRVVEEECEGNAIKLIKVNTKHQKGQGKKKLKSMVKEKQQKMIESPIPSKYTHI